MFLFSLLACSQTAWVPMDGHWLVIELLSIDGDPIAYDQYPCGAAQQTRINGDPVEPVCSPASSAVYAVPVEAGLVDVSVKPDYHVRYMETVRIDPELRITQLTVVCDYVDLTN